MTDEDLRNTLAALPPISTVDRIADDLFPSGFTTRYELKSFRNAATLLWAAHDQVVSELFQVLNSFSVTMDEILLPGGNKSQIAKKLEAILHPLGWYETRISGDLVVRKRSKALNVTRKSPKFVKIDESSVLSNFLDGHQIDFVKGRVAFDLEWNSKDQTFDRDLYAMRAFYECGIIDAGIILTRSTNLSSMLADIARRVSTIKSFKDKYGASTTWMGKLDYRINAGRAGGCPILALGFEEPIFSEIDAWRARNPIINEGITVEKLMGEDSDDG